MKIGIAHDRELDSVHRKMVESVSEVLQNNYEVTSIPFDNNFMNRVEGIDFVFNLSTAGGESEKQVHVPAVLDFMKVPFTGSGVTANCLCIDKALTKSLMVGAGIPTPEFVLVHPGDSPEEIAFYPAIVKPSREGNAAGVWSDSVVYDKEDLERNVKRIHEKYIQPALVESFIEGREFSVGILDREVLPILEIDFSSLPEGLERFYSHRIKQDYGEETNYVCPAEIPEKTKNNIESMALKLFDLLSLKDYARIDLRLDAKGEVYFLEVNSLPLIAPEYSDIVKMIQAAGWEYGVLIEKILKSAMKRQYR